MAGGGEPVSFRRTYLVRRCHEFAFEPRHDRPGEEHWRLAVCSGRFSRDVLALYDPEVAAGASLAEAYEAVAHDVRATAALKLEKLAGQYKPPLIITAEDRAAWMRAGQPDGDLKA